ncbi:MAG: peptide chain release factor N(5)-glutamine methyltransferase [Paludibacteraceae bacterium]|nr:peptide chain release factor N(5)-glutamine methyltransferase [Paludibacteraceae bacterium]
MKELIDDISARLLARYPEDEARSLAWWIAEEMTGLTRTQLLFGDKGTAFFSHLQEKLPEIIDRLLKFEPIQYIFGHTIWSGLDLKVTPATLIPRPETAELVQRINALTANNLFPIRGTKGVSLLDIGTGSGCIAIALKKAHPEWRVTGIDISPEAIEVAKENACRNNAKVEFQVADIFSDENGVIEPLGGEEIEHFGTYDIIVSNPPYICESEKISMRPNVLDFEPENALFVPDEDPLLFYRRIANLHLGKYLYFEINEAFSPEMKDLLESEGYTDIQITNDIYGKPRIIEGRMVK